MYARIIARAREDILLWEYENEFCIHFKSRPMYLLVPNICKKLAQNKSEFSIKYDGDYHILFKKNALGEMLNFFKKVYGINLVDL